VGPAVCPFTWDTDSAKFVILYVFEPIKYFSVRSLLLPNVFKGGTKSVKTGKHWVCYFRGRSKVIPVFNEVSCCEDVLGSGGIVPPILNLGVGGSVVSFTPQLLYPCGKYPLDMRLGGPHGQSGCGGEEKKSVSCPLQEESVFQMNIYFIFTNVSYFVIIHITVECLQVLYCVFIWNILRNT
jgi:hypothetical protein